MYHPARSNMLVIPLLALTLAQASYADQVKILKADLQNSGGDRWSVSVTLMHGDEGWEHYADAWRVVDSEGNVLGTRVLHHPHIQEQPFSRSLTGIAIPRHVKTVYIEAHDKVHGWAKARLKANLGEATNGRLVVEADR